MDTHTHLLSLIETGKPLEIKRALAVRLSLLGESRSKIAEMLDVSVQFVDKWKPIYFEEGIDGLKLKYKGSEGYLSKQEKQLVIHYIQQQQTITPAELKVYISKHYGVTYSNSQSYTTLLHQAGFSYKKTQKMNPKGDQEQINAKKKRSKR